MSRRNLEQQKETVSRFIRQKQTPTVSDITSITMVNVARVFRSIREAYAAAGVPYGKKPKDVKRQEIIAHIKKNSLATINDINKAVNCSFYKYFTSLKSACKIAGVRYYNRHTKRTERKRQEVLIYIRKHPEATQREINSACKTKIQEIFGCGTSEAFNQAGVPYDFERRRVHGAAIKSIRVSASNLESEIFDILRKEFGKDAVLKHFRVKHGIADMLVSLGNRKAIIEIKDYRIKPIGSGEVKQVRRYLNQTGADVAAIITNKMLNKNNEIRGIRIFESSELDKALSFLREHLLK